MVVCFVSLLLVLTPKQKKIYINKNIINVQIADTPLKISRGLMFQENLKENDGMLFVFDKESFQSFWMKNTLIPLDIIFIDKDYKIVDIKNNFEPCKQSVCSSYISKKPAMYVVEVNANWCNKNQVQIGNKVVIR